MKFLVVEEKHKPTTEYLWDEDTQLRFGLMDNDAEFLQAKVWTKEANVLPNKIMKGKQTFHLMEEGD